MNLLLVILLLLLGIVIFFVMKKNICAPSVILCGVFFLSAFVAWLNTDKWQFTLRPITIIVILTAIIAFAVGEFLVNLAFDKKYPNRKYQPDLEIMDIPWYVTVVVCIIMLGMLWYYYGQVKAVAERYPEWDGTLQRMVFWVRYHTTWGNGDLSKGANHVSCFARCIAYVFLFFFFKGMVYGKEKWKYVINILPAILYFPFIALIGERTGYIKFIAYAVIIWSFLYLAKQTDGVKTKMIICIVLIVSTALFLLCFQMLGKIKGGKLDGTFQYVSEYVAWSIPALDEYIQNPLPKDNYFGEHTLHRVYAITNRLGITDVEISVRYWPDVHLKSGFYSNVYTAFARYIQDYGYMGLWVVMCLIGIVYAVMRNIIVCDRNQDLKLILYAMFFYPITLMSIDEVFLIEIVSSTTVYLVAETFFVYFLITKMWKTGDAF